MFEISQLAQVEEEIFETNKNKLVRPLSRAVKYAVENRISLRISKLDFKCFRIIGISNALFANNHESSSQLGHVCFFGNDTGAAAPIFFKSSKVRQLTQSARSGEVIAFSNFFNLAITLAEKNKQNSVKMGTRTTFDRQQILIRCNFEGIKNSKEKPGAGYSSSP